MDRRTIFQTIEVFQREFDDSILLAYQLAKIGYRVYLGEYYNSLEVAKHAKKKCIFKHNSGLLNLLGRKKFKPFNHAIVIEDLESSLSLPLDYLEDLLISRLKPQIENFEYEAFLSPSPYHKAVIDRLIKNHNRNTASHFVGKNLFSSEDSINQTASVSDKIGKFGYENIVVFFSSFGAVHRDDWQRDLDHPGNCELDRIIIQERWDAMRDIVIFFCSLSELLDDRTCVVFRPHNSESVSEWEDIFRSHENILVRKGDPLDELLEIGDVIAHASSNVGLQAVLRRKPTYNILPKGSMKSTLSALVSVEIRDPYEFSKILKERFSEPLARPDVSLLSVFKSIGVKPSDFERELVLSRVVSALNLIHIPAQPEVHIPFYLLAYRLLKRYAFMLFVVTGIGTLFHRNFGWNFGLRVFNYRKNQIDKLNKKLVEYSIQKYATNKDAGIKLTVDEVYPKVFKIERC